MLKILGSLMIIICSGLIGITKNREIKDEIEFARGAKNGLLYIKSEIRVSSVLGAAVKNAVLFSGEASYIFKRTYEILNEDKTFEFAFLNAIESVSDPKMKDILGQVGKRLGKNDLKDQENLIDMTAEKIDLYIKIKTEELKTKGELFKKTGFILGIAAVIVLL